MGRTLRWAAPTLVALLCLARGAGADAVVGSIDDFQGSHNWVGNTEFVPCGGCGPPTFLCLCPPSSMQQGVSTEASGGPDGLLDSFLRLSELPSHGLESWNRAANRTGNYTAAGIGSVALDLRNFGPGNLEVRLGLERGTTRWATSDSAAVALASGSGWTAADFQLLESDMTRVAGSASLASVLSDVEEIRILHATAAQSTGSDGPNLGVDNVLLPEPAAVACLALGAALLAVLARRSRA